MAVRRENWYFDPVWFSGGGGMRENYNRPQMRGYWDAPKSKDDSRYEMLFLYPFARLFLPSFVRSFLCSLARSLTRSFVRLFVRLIVKTATCCPEFSLIWPSVRIRATLGSSDWKSKLSDFRLNCACLTERHLAQSSRLVFHFRSFPFCLKPIKTESATELSRVTRFIKLAHSRNNTL